MYYVIQVNPREGLQTERVIRASLPLAVCPECFHLSRLIPKKVNGEWTTAKELLLPGYLFLETNMIMEAYEKLRAIPRFIRLLGHDDMRFNPLDENDTAWLLAVISETNCYEVPLSKVYVDENNNKTVLSGPLKSVENLIKKINLHKRVAEVRVNFAQKKLIHMGIQIVHSLDEFQSQ